MRIISGTQRGRKLLSPKGETTRPTHDRTREAVFSALQQVIPGARVLDCFAGSGAMALEALSRGAAEALLLESDRDACSVIQENIRLTGMEKKARLLHGDALSALQILPAQGFDLVILDPPYGQGLAEKALRILTQRRLLNADAVIVAETAFGEQLDLPDELLVIKDRNYGKNRIRFLKENTWTQGDT